MILLSMILYTVSDMTSTIFEKNKTKKQLVCSMNFAHFIN